jgi:hypothetical protein
LKINDDFQTGNRKEESISAPVPPFRHYFSEPYLTEKTMKKTLSIILIIFLSTVLGCVLPFETGQKEKNPPPPATEKDTSAENERLKEKIAELEKKKLEEKIEDLEEKIEDQKKQTPGKTIVKTVPVKPPPKGFVRVNSPRDGFLALRSQPSVNGGYRMVKIPHGTVISVYSCGGLTTVGGRRGRWCRTVYEDNPGWVFDAYLVR